MRKMRIHLTPGSIGVKAGQEETIQLAHDYGYEAVEPQPEFLGGISVGDLKKILDFMASRQLVFGSAGLGVEFRNTEEQFQDGMKSLLEQSKGLQRAGVTRVGTWIRPAHDRFTYRQYFDLHVKRLGAIAAVFDDHNIRLGLEYVGPKLSWSEQRYPFIHSMAETKELIGAIGRKNVGFVLDSWHWYTAREPRRTFLR
jgi:sugar phosphate isomerase/epimerase